MISKVVFFNLLIDFKVFFVNLYNNQKDKKIYGRTYVALYE
jgi:hypothetical protein